MSEVMEVQRDRGGGWRDGVCVPKEENVRRLGSGCPFNAWPFPFVCPFDADSGTTPFACPFASTGSSVLTRSRSLCPRMRRSSAPPTGSVLLVTFGAGGGTPLGWYADVLFEWRLGPVPFAVEAPASRLPMCANESLPLKPISSAEPNEDAA